ncbi:MAG: YihY/virulence factor BrkB family protein [Ilumatobacteraceae bacterium]
MDDADVTTVAIDEPRGRDADRPRAIPAKGWKDIAARTLVETKEDNVALLAAGMAFYALLALVPALIATISIYGIVADPASIGEQVISALAAAPTEVRELVTTQLESIAESSGGTALFATIVGIALALWSASSGVLHMIAAINAAYDEKETRKFLKLRLLSLLLTAGTIVFLMIAFAAIALLPALLADTGLGAVGRVLANFVRWVVLLGAMLAGLAILYRIAPDRDDPQWKWVTPGALVASALWIVGSLLFSLYTANFAKYNETYGSLGAIIVVMLWLFLTAYAVILGAELNSEVERQTVRDTTEGSEQPLGERGAHSADTVGETADELHPRDD